MKKRILAACLFLSLSIPVLAQQEDESNKKLFIKLCCNIASEQNNIESANDENVRLVNDFAEIQQQWCSKCSDYLDQGYADKKILQMMLENDVFLTPELTQRIQNALSGKKTKTQDERRRNTRESDRGRTNRDEENLKGSARNGETERGRSNNDPALKKKFGNIKDEKITKDI